MPCSRILPLGSPVFPSYYRSIGYRVYDLGFTVAGLEVPALGVVALGQLEHRLDVFQDILPLHPNKLNPKLMNVCRPYKP